MLQTRVCGFLTGVLIAVSIFPAKAQITGPAGNLTFTWGQKYDLPAKHDDLGFIGNSTDGYIQIGHRNHETLTFQKFDPKLHLLKEVETNLESLPHVYNNESFVQIGNKYYWFFSTWERSEAIERLFVQEIDLKASSLVGTAREIASSTKLTGEYVATGLYQLTLVNKWNFYYSFDKSRVLVQYRKKPERRDDSKSNDVIGFAIFDKDMQPLWNREIQMPYTEMEMDNEGYQVDRRGNIYTLAKIYDAGTKDRKVYHFEILKWMKDKTEVTKIPFTIADKFIATTGITEDADGNVIVAGYYSSNKKALKENASTNAHGFYNPNAGAASVDGMFMLKLDADKNELVNVMKGTYEFPVSLIEQFESNRAKRHLEKADEKDNLEIGDLVFRNITINSDGSTQITGEEYYLFANQFGSGANAHTGKTRYAYNNIVTINIGSDGNIKWAQKIPKSQMGTKGTGNMSFKQYIYGGDTYFFFMDDIKNRNLAMDKPPVQYIDGEAGVLAAVKIDALGKMTKGILYNIREEHVRLTVTDFADAGNNQIIARGRGRHHESQAALITFK